jgi:drug/metabolite transporter (DMT)-like permease
MTAPPLATNPPDADAPPATAATAPDPTAAPGARPTRPWAGYAFAAGGAVLFSTKAVLIKLAYAEGINTETLLALRMALSLPFFLVIGARAARERGRRGEGPVGRRLLVRACWVGVLGYWLASYADFLGLNHISAHFERLILFTYPGFVLLFGALFFGQPVRARSLVALGLSYVGLAVIFTADLRAGGSNVPLGAGLVLTAAVSFALYQLLAKGVIGRMGPQLFTCVAMTAAAAVAIGQFLLTQPPAALWVGPRLLVHGLLLAVGATVLPSLMLNAALHRISAQANSVIGTLSPVVTIALAVLLLGERLGPADAVGAVLVMAGVGWFTLADRKRG